MQLRKGDFDDTAGLATAFKGIDRLLIIPASDLRPGIRLPQHKTAIASAKQAGVKHLIYISTVGAHRGQDLFATHVETELAVYASGLPWTILRIVSAVQSKAGVETPPWEASSRAKSASFSMLRREKCASKSPLMMVGNFMPMRPE